MENDDVPTLHHMDTRITLLENEFGTFTLAHSDFKKWVRGIAVIVILQVLGGAMAFAKLSQQVETLDLDDMQLNVSTSLAVLAAHGNEIQAVRDENARLRTVIDTVRDEITVRTANRFSSHDGARVESRVKRIEDLLLQQKREAR